MRMKKLICSCGGILSIKKSVSVDGIAQARMRSCNACQRNFYSVEQPFADQEKQKALFLQIVRDRQAAKRSQRVAS
jgi:hypothetical protein